MGNRRRQQSVRFGTRVLTETVNRADLQHRPFTVYSDETEVSAETVIVATGLLPPASLNACCTSFRPVAISLCACVGAVAKRLDFKGSGETDGYWNKGISACAVCDGAAPMFRRKPLIVIGGGDSAMEEAIFLTRYGSKVYILHRRDEFRASKIMQARAFANPKIEVRFKFNPFFARAIGKGAKCKAVHLCCR